MSDNIQIRIIKEQDYGEVLEFMRKNFYAYEPLNVSKPMEPENEEFFKPFIPQGLSLMAEEVLISAQGDETRKLVGATIAGKNDPGQVDYLKKLAAQGDAKSHFVHVMNFLVVLESGSNVFKRFGVTKTVHSHMTAVDESQRGKGIGIRLRKALMALGKERGYTLMTVDCTSYYSARQCENLGMECVNMIYYKDYVDAEGKPYFNVKPPHDRARSFVMHL